MSELPAQIDDFQLETDYLHFFSRSQICVTRVRPETEPSHEIIEVQTDKFSRQNRYRNDFKVMKDQPYLQAQRNMKRIYSHQRQEQTCHPVMYIKTVR